MNISDPDSENEDYTEKVCSHKNDESTVNRLVNENMALAKFWANKFVGSVGDMDEAMSSAMRGLLRAAQEFNPANGFAFGALGSVCIKHSLIRTLAKIRAKKRNYGVAPVSIHTPMSEDQELLDKLACPNSDPLARTDDEAIRSQIERALSGLPARDADILKRRFGIGCESETLEEIARSYKMSRQAIEQIEKRSLKKAALRAGHVEKNFEKVVREAKEEQLLKNVYPTILYPFQSVLAAQTLGALGNHSRVVMTLPTGGGKTATCVHGILPFMQEPILWMTHRRELVSQARKELMAGGVPADVRTIQSFKKGAKKYKTVVIDEGHHVCADLYLSIFDMFPEAKFLALTATPYRLDGQGLGSCGFSQLVLGPDIFELTEQKYLTPATTLVPENEGTGAWPIDRAAKEIQKHTQSIFAAIAYLARVKDADEICQELIDQGIVARSIHKDTKNAIRKMQSEDFRKGLIKVLCNHTIFTEGYDAPSADCVVLNRITQSRCLWKQMVGRGLRVKEGKSRCLILDLAGNAFIHGSIYDREIYDLSGTVESTEPRECPSADRGPISLRYSKEEKLKLWKPKISTVELRNSLLRRRSASPWRKFVTAS